MKDRLMYVHIEGGRIVDYTGLPGMNHYTDIDTPEIGLFSEFHALAVL